MIKQKCMFCGYEEKYKQKGKILKTGRCPKCGGFMRIMAEEYKVKGVENES